MNKKVESLLSQQTGLGRSRRSDSAKQKLAMVETVFGYSFENWGLVRLQCELIVFRGGRQEDVSTEVLHELTKKELKDFCEFLGLNVGRRFNSEKLRRLVLGELFKYQLGDGE